MAPGFFDKVKRIAKTVARVLPKAIETGTKVAKTAATILEQVPIPQVQTASKVVRMAGDGLEGMQELIGRMERGNQERLVGAAGGTRGYRRGPLAR